MHTFVNYLFYVVEKKLRIGLFLLQVEILLVKFVYIIVVAVIKNVV